MRFNGRNWFRRIGNESRFHDDGCDLAKLLGIKTLETKDLHPRRFRSQQIGGGTPVFQLIPLNTANSLAPEHLVKSARLKGADVGDKPLIRLQSADRSLPHALISVIKVDVDAAQPEKT